MIAGRAAAVVAALAVVPVAQGAHRAPGGVFGVVSRGPITPVCVETRPCSAPAAGALVQVLRGSAVVATGRTASDGSYRIALAPGSYLIRVARSFKPRSLPIVVRAGWTRQNLSIDTGIRTAAGPPVVG